MIHQIKSLGWERIQWLKKREKSAKEGQKEFTIFLENRFFLSLGFYSSRFGSCDFRTYIFSSYVL